jgi:hypothetical protein
MRYRNRENEKKQSPEQPRRTLMSQRCTIRLAFSLLAIAGGAHLGCSFTTINAAPGSGSSLEEGDSAKAAIKSRAKIVDQGNFVVSYGPATKKELKVVAKAVKDAEALSQLLPDLNANFALETDLPIVFSECGIPNAHYDPNEQKITICYEFIRYLSEGFTQVFDKDEDADAALTNALTFFFFHELGHALIHIDQIPSTGGAEAAADQFATFLLLTLGDEAKLTALHAAVAFARIVGATDSLDNETLGDEHPLGRQRAYSILCWVYGAKPDERDMRDTVKTAGLPESRLDRCGEEYVSMNNSWLELLGPHLKQEATTTSE